MGQLQNQFQQMMGGQSPYSGGGQQQQWRPPQQQPQQGQGGQGQQQRGNFGTQGYQQPQTRGTGGYSGQPQQQGQLAVLPTGRPVDDAARRAQSGLSTDYTPRQQSPLPQGWQQAGYSMPYTPGPSYQAGANPGAWQQQPPMQLGINGMPGRGGMPQPNVSGDNWMMQNYNDEQERMKDPAYAAQRAAAQKAWNERPVQQGRTGAMINGQPGQPPPSTGQGMQSQPLQTGGFKPEKGQPQLSGPPMMPPVRQDVDPGYGPPQGTGGFKPSKEPVEIRDPRTQPLGPPVHVPPDAKPMGQVQAQPTAAGAMQGGSVSQPLGQMQPGYGGPRPNGYRNPYKKQQGFGGGPQPDGGPEYSY